VDRGAIHSRSSRRSGKLAIEEKKSRCSFSPGVNGAAPHGGCLPLAPERPSLASRQEMGAAFAAAPLFWRVRSPVRQIVSRASIFGASGAAAAGAAPSGLAAPQSPSVLSVTWGALPGPCETIWTKRLQLLPPAELLDTNE
jgi:hypothetical protein